MGEILSQFMEFLSGLRHGIVDYIRRMLGRRFSRGG
jgi:hypothetical protein